MDSLVKMLNRLKPNDPSFKERFIQITSVYCAPFDSDTAIQYLSEGTLREEKNGDGFIYIPCIEYSVPKNEYIFPDHIIIGDDVKIPFPESIEELRSMCLSNSVKIELNTDTATKLFS